MAATLDRMGVPGERAGYGRGVETRRKRLNTHRLSADLDRGKHRSVLFRPAVVEFALRVQDKGGKFVITKQGKIHAVRNGGRGGGIPTRGGTGLDEIPYSALR